MGGPHWPTFHSCNSTDQFAPFTNFSYILTSSSPIITNPGSYRLLSSNSDFSPLSRAKNTFCSSIFHLPSRILSVNDSIYFRNYLPNFKISGFKRQVAVTCEARNIPSFQLFSTLSHITFFDEADTPQLPTLISSPVMLRSIACLSIDRSVPWDKRQVMRPFIHLRA